MEVVLTHAAEIGRRSLGEEDRRRIDAWVHHLQNWENDASVRSQSHMLEMSNDDQIYLLHASSDLRLFFTVKENRIDVIDIAREDSLRVVSRAS